MRVLGICLFMAVAASPSMSNARVITGSPIFAVANENIGNSTIDLDGDGQSDLSVSADLVPGNYITRWEASAGAAYGADLLLTPAPLTPGSTVDGSLPFNLSSVALIAQTDSRNPLDPSTNFGGGVVHADYGFRFNSRGAIHYGWAGIQVEAGGTAVAVIHPWGYESEPNTPITVGAVPEPASAALLLIGAPVLFRRRRSA